MDLGRYDHQLRHNHRRPELNYSILVAKDTRPFGTLIFKKKTFSDSGYGIRTFSDLVHFFWKKKAFERCFLPFKGKNFCVIKQLYTTPRVSFYTLLPLFFCISNPNICKMSSLYPFLLFLQTTCNVGRRYRLFYSLCSLYTNRHIDLA